MSSKRDIIKILIEVSPTAEKADKIIEENFKFDSIGEKIAFLKGMFDIKCIGHDKKDEATYYAMLNAIINS